MNDAPSFTKGDNQSVNEDAAAQSVPWATNISAGPADESGQALNFIVANNNNSLFTSGGQPSIAPNGTLTYTSAPDANGIATVSVRLKDNGGGDDTSAEQTFTITVNPVNDAPVAQEDTKTTDEDQPLTFPSSDLVVNDDEGAANEEGQALRVTNVSNPTRGTVSLASEGGDITFTPERDFNGEATFDYTVCDNGNPNKCSVETAIVKVTVSAVNDAPSFTKGDNQSVNEDAGAHTISPWATAISAGPADESGQALNFIVANDNSNLFTAAGQPAVSADGALSYTLAPNANGIATVSVRLKDNGGGDDTSAEQTFTITVNPVNDDPVAAADTDTTAEDTPKNIAVLPNDTDIDRDDLRVAGVNQPANGSATTNPDGTIRYVPNANYFGTDSFTYVVADGKGATAQGTVSITVSPVNDNPVVTTVSNNGPVAEGSPAAITVNARDVDNADGDLRYSFDCNNDNDFETGPQPENNAPCTFADNGTKPVNVRVADGAGGAAAGSTSVGVTNVDPRIASFTGSNYFYGPLSFLGSTASSSKFSGAWTDPGTADTWTALLNYPDGAPLTDTLGPGLTTPSFQNVDHKFASAGCKTTKLTVTDDDNGSATATVVSNIGTGSFMAPMTNQPVTDKLKNGQVLPVKVKFTDCNGVALTNLKPEIRLVKGDLTPQSDDTAAQITPASTSAADTTGVMRSNGDGSYIYNMNVNITLNTDFTVMIYPYGTGDPQKLGHVIQATK